MNRGIVVLHEGTLTDKNTSEFAKNCGFSVIEDITTQADQKKHNQRFIMTSDYFTEGEILYEVTLQAETFRDGTPTKYSATVKPSAEQN